MSKKLLHITNGDGLAEQIQALNISGDVLIWREMLCEGPTVINVSCEESLILRKKFLKETYNIDAESYEQDFIQELKKLETADQYDEIILWFEFDLFCHVNMIAIISYLLDRNYKVPVSLVCSKRLKGEQPQNGLSHLNEQELFNHYEAKISLNTDDLELANLVWNLYCEKNPKKLKPENKKSSNFEYLSSCIRAHLERFPSVKNGLNSIEQNILKLIENNTITSQNQLLGYALEYQGYYGYSDVQMLQIIEALNGFFTLEKDQFILTDAGNAAVNYKQNFYSDLKSDLRYGGVLKYDFLYDPETHNLMKL